VTCATWRWVLGVLNSGVKAMQWSEVARTPREVAAALAKELSRALDADLGPIVMPMPDDGGAEAE